MKRLGIASLILCVAVLMGIAFGHGSSLESAIGIHNDADGGGLTVGFSGWVISNPNASASQEFDLPDAKAGLTVTFGCAVAQNIVVDPASGDRILSLTSATNDSITGGAVGAVVTLTAIDDTSWLPTSVVGSWADTN